jgi:hypothetical protein
MGQVIEEKTWRQLLLVVALLLPLSITFSILSEIDETFEGLFLFYNFPGFIVYVFSTGDIHGWKPGPIGQAGRVCVIAVGSWSFWSLVLFAIYMAKQITRRIRQ